MNVNTTYGKNKHNGEYDYLAPVISDRQRSAIETLGIDTSKLSSPESSGLFTLVDLRSPPYNKHFRINPGSDFQENSYTGGAYLVEKSVAEGLVRAAKDSGYDVVVVNSAFRSQALNNAVRDKQASQGLGSDKVARGSSHETGMALDVQTFLTSSEARNLSTASFGKSADKDRRWKVIKTVQNNKEKYGIIDGVTKYKSDDVHFEHAKRSELESKYPNLPVALNNAAYAYSKANKFSAGKPGYGMVLDAKSGKIAHIKGDPIKDVSKLSFEEVSAAPPRIRRIASSLGLSSGSNTQVSSASNWRSFNPVAPNIPRDLQNAKEAKSRMITIDSERINALSRVSPAEMTITSMTDKVIKNAYPGRNPMGLEHKHDAPPAALKLVQDKLFTHDGTYAGSDAEKAWLALESAGLSYIDNFFIENMTKISEERYHLLQTLSEDYKVYFSGKRPSAVNLSGRMLNTYNHQWWYDFEFFYENYLRGTKAVKNHIRIFLNIADAIYEIILLKFGVISESQFDNNIRFNIDALLLQTVYTGEYLAPIHRVENPADSLSKLNISLGQVNMSDNTKKIISAYDKATKDPGSLAYKNTSVQSDRLDPKQAQSADLGAVSSGKPVNIKLINAQAQADANKYNKKLTRDSLRNQPYANAIKQVLLNKSPESNISEEKLLSAAGKNKKLSQGLLESIGKASDFITKNMADFNNALDTKYDYTRLDLKKMSFGKAAGTVISAANQTHQMAKAFSALDNISGQGMAPKAFHDLVTARPIDKQEIRKVTGEATQKGLNILNTLTAAGNLIKFRGM